MLGITTLFRNFIYLPETKEKLLEEMEEHWWRDGKPPER